MLGRSWELLPIAQRTEPLLYQRGRVPMGPSTGGSTLASPRRCGSLRLANQPPGDRPGRASRGGAPRRSQAGANARANPSLRVEGQAPRHFHACARRSLASCLVAVPGAGPVRIALIADAVSPGGMTSVRTTAGVGAWRRHPGNTASGPIVVVWRIRTLRIELLGGFRSRSRSGRFRRGVAPEQGGEPRQAACAGAGSPAAPRAGDGRAVARPRTCRGGRKPAQGA
jgi:hypothetical protein